MKKKIEIKKTQPVGFEPRSSQRAHIVLSIQSTNAISDVAETSFFLFSYFIGLR